jgi:hypothetical protein
MSADSSKRNKDISATAQHIVKSKRSQQPNQPNKYHSTQTKPSAAKRQNSPCTNQSPNSTQYPHQAKAIPY